MSGVPDFIVFLMPLIVCSQIAVRGVFRRTKILLQEFKFLHHAAAVGESRMLVDVARAEACYRDSLANAVQAVRSERLT